jgi:predicted NBD/HSP70 family sugar kinase
VTPDPDYHYNGIVTAMKTAASKMPRVDAIGVSSAGIYIDNRTAVASLFLKVPEELYEKKVRDIYIRAAKEFGDVPLVVANDGDVTALAGADSIGDGCVLGVAMGTSEAVGYVNDERGINGWLNELAFAPVDCSPSAMRDEWAGDTGCGVKYFSQDGINKLAANAGIDFGGADTPAEKLKIVQKLMQEKDARAEAVYRSTGIQLGHTVALYAMFYDIRHMLLLGRVMSGDGGNIIVSEARRVLAEEYPETAEHVSICLPDEKMRRVGQSVTAAGLPVLAAKN